MTEKFETTAAIKSAFCNLNHTQHETMIMTNNIVDSNDSLMIMPASLVSHSSDLPMIKNTIMLTIEKAKYPSPTN